MGRVADWWMSRTAHGDWRLPISSVQGFRLIGGFLVGTSTTLEFVPNRLEALAGGSSWTTAIDDIESVTLGRRRLRIVAPEEAGGSRTLFTNRREAVRLRLADLLTQADSRS